MIVFEIRDKAQKGRLLGYLFYYEKSKRFFSELLEDTDEWTCPFIFSGFVKKGNYSIDSIWSGKFVNQRIIPPDRQNLGSILRENGLKEYDEFKLLQLSEGRCAQDELYLVRIQDKDIIPEVQNRLDKKVLDVMVLEDYNALVFFRDKKGFVIDVKKAYGENRLFGNILRNEELYRYVRVSPGGNGIEWGEERFIPAEEIRRSGKESLISYDDIKGFIKERLVDSAETAKILNCSRQYIKQLADKERLSAVREGANTNIYLKSILESESY